MPDGGEAALPRAAENGAFTSERRGPALVIAFHGEIQSSDTGGIRRDVLSAIEREGVTRVVFDLSDVSYIDSMGLGMFVNLHVRGRDRLRFLFCGLTGSVRKAFGYVKLISFLQVRDSLEDALGEFADADD